MILEDNASKRRVMHYDTIIAPQNAMRVYSKSKEEGRKGEERGGGGKELTFNIN